MNRQIILDTETTGLDPNEGHRLIEIGAVEMIDRKLTGQSFHRYLNPEREIDAGALAVHGINNQFLADKPRFPEILVDLLAFIQGAELVIHNAAFDVGFLEHEMRLSAHKPASIIHYCTILDTLLLARQLHPGQKNNLDALCKRYKVDNSHRERHGALLDAEILARVYLAMTGGQSSFFDSSALAAEKVRQQSKQKRKLVERLPLAVILANVEEEAAHQALLAHIARNAESGCIWLQD